MKSSFMKPLLLSFIVSGALMIGQGQTTLDRTVIPKPQAVPRIALPNIQKAKLHNGLNVWLVEQHELPSISCNLVFQSGSAFDPLGKPGIASMTADVIDEGTAKRDALQISEELNFIGAGIGVSSNVDGTFMSLRTLTRHLDKALDIFVDVLTNPTFPEKEFERLRKQRLTSLLQQKDRPSTIASNSFYRIIYGDAHPYGLDASGTEQSLSQMTRDDLVQFYQTHYRPNNATLIVVGDAKMKDIVKRLEKGLATWLPATLPVLEFPPTPEVDTRRVYLIDKPGAAQSEIRIGYPALARNTPDYFSVTLMNRILGGQFSSRLNLNLREKRGFSYGVRSGFTMSKKPGPFTASGGVTSAKTDSSLQEFFYEIDKMFKEGVTDEEVTFVKKGLTGGFALSFETSSQIAGALQNLVLYKLPDNYYETYLVNIDKVPVDEIQTAARKYLDTSRMAVVVVGDLELIRKDVERMNLGDVVICDTNGKPITK